MERLSKSQNTCFLVYYWPLLNSSILIPIYRIQFHFSRTVHHIPCCENKRHREPPWCIHFVLLRENGQQWDGQPMCFQLRYSRLDIRQWTVCLHVPHNPNWHHELWRKVIHLWSMLIRTQRGWWVRELKKPYRPYFCGNPPPLPPELFLDRTRFGNPRRV